MTKTDILTPELLRQLLDYDPETGLLTWKARGSEWFCETKYKGGTRPASWAMNKFNTKCAGKVALNNKMCDGRRRGAVLGVHILAHRAIWAVIYGAFPVNGIDHIDGDPSNNRLGNLRDVPQVVNAKNAATPKHNSSGVIGVGWYKASGKWRADIKIGQKAMFLGYFHTKEEAICARKLAESKYGFHENHGRAARLAE